VYPGIDGLANSETGVKFYVGVIFAGGVTPELGVGAGVMFEIFDILVIWLILVLLLGGVKELMLVLLEMLLILRVLLEGATIGTLLMLVILVLTLIFVALALILEILVLFMFIGWKLLLLGI
jgi:hypothetical protein